MLAALQTDQLLYFMPTSVAVGKNTSPKIIYILLTFPCRFVWTHFFPLVHTWNDRNLFDKTPTYEVYLFGENKLTCESKHLLVSFFTCWQNKYKNFQAAETKHPTPYMEGQPLCSVAAKAESDVLILQTMAEH